MTNTNYEHQQTPSSLTFIQRNQKDSLLLPNSERIILKSENKVPLQKKNIRFAKEYHFLGGYCPNFQVKFRQLTPLAFLVWTCHGNLSREA